jgi:hypothetical protein
MPQNNNLFDDDSLLPDWMRDADLGGQSQEEPFEADGTVFTSAQQPQPTAGPEPSGPAPWDHLRGSAPPRPGLTEAAPPWEVLGGEYPPPPDRAVAAAPWQILGGGAYELPPGARFESGQEPGVIADIESADQDEKYFDWSGATSGATQQGDRPGLTAMLGDLPWKEEEAPKPPAPPSAAERAGLSDKQFTMSDLMDDFKSEPPAEAPPPQKKGSLVDRLRAASAANQPPPEPPAAQFNPQQDEWLSGFGQAGGFQVAGASDSGDDLDWLTAGSESAPPPTQSPTPPPPSGIKKLGAAPPLAAQPAEPPLEQDFDDLFPDEFVDDFMAEEEPPAAVPAADDDDDLPWLDDSQLTAPPALRAASKPAPQPAPPSEPEQNFPDWLNVESGEAEEIEPEQEEEAPPPSKELPSWVTNPEETRRATGIRRIGQSAPPPDSGLTYEEWEHLQIEREHEAQKTPEERMLEEVPDFFKQLDSPQPQQPSPSATTPPPGGSGPEFMPGWFVGLEEKLPDDVPDWMRNMDYSSDLLAQPFGAAQEPEPPPPAASDVPDWFSGAAAPDMDGLDWNAMFSAPAPQPEPTPEPAPGPARSPAPPPPEPPADDWAAWDAVEQAAPAQDDLSAAWDAAEALSPADDDWAADSAPAAPAADDFDLPDIDLLAGLEDAGDEPLAPADMPSWLAAAAPPGGQIAAPDEIPFPDLDLDQTMPGETSLADLFDQMDTEAPFPAPHASVEPEAEAEDFVERFDPMEPTEYAPSAPAAGRSLDQDAPGWLREMAAEGELPADLYPAPATDWETPAEPLPEEQLDWLEGISPGDVSAADLFEPAGQSLVEMPPKPEPGFRPDAGLFDTDSRFDSAALDNLLGLYEPGTPSPPAPDLPDMPDMPAPFWDEGPSFMETGGSLEAASDVFEVSGAPDPGLQAMFAEADAGQALPDLETLFDDSRFQESLGALNVGEEPPAPAPDSRRRPPVPETAPVFKPDAAPGAPEGMLPPALHPEWVGELRPTDLPVVVRAGGAETSIKQKQVTELPERLRAFRDLSLHELETTAEDSAEIAAIVMPKTGPRPVEGLVITKEQQSRLNKLQALLDQVAAEETEVEQDRADFDEAAQMALTGIPMGEEPLPEAHAKTKPARRKTRRKADRVLVALLLLIGLIAPFATDTLHFADDPAPLGGTQQAVALAVDAVTPGSYVLFAFEYGPTAAGELDPLAEALLRDVLDHNAIPLITSTNPAGVFHAEAVIAPLVEDARLLAVRGQNESALAAGEDYVILGYLPGEAVGVRLLTVTEENANGTFEPHPAFKTDLRGDNTNLPIGSLERDVPLIVVVGEDSNAVRTWAEQLERVPVFKVALVTASLEPLTVPYINPTAYMGYLAGVRDAYRYDTARNNDSRAPYTLPDDLPVDLPNPEESRWHSMALGAAAAAGLIALGLVLNLFRGLLRRRR